MAYLAPRLQDIRGIPSRSWHREEANEPYLSSALATVKSIVGSLEQAGFGRERIVVVRILPGRMSGDRICGQPSGSIRRFDCLYGRSDRAARFAPHACGDLAGTPALLCSGDPDPPLCPGNACGGVRSDPERDGCESHDKALHRPASYDHAG